MRRYLDLIKENFFQFGIFCKQLSLDDKLKNAYTCIYENNGQFPLRVVEKLIQALLNTPYHEVYFDIFFSLTSLCKNLSTKDLKCTGTVGHNRTDACPTTSPANMKKKERGHF